MQNAAPAGSGQTKSISDRHPPRREMENAALVASEPTKSIS